MNPETIITAVAWEDAGAVLLGRILDYAGAALTQAAVTSLKMYGYKEGTATAKTELNTGGTALVVSSTIFDTLQTGTIWTVDTTGYNFKYSITPASGLLQTPGWYRIEIPITPATGALIPLVYRIKVLGLWSS